MKSISMMLVGASLAAVTIASPVSATDFVVGPQTSSYTGYTRGYYFTATSSFTINSLFIPTDASNANQWAQVIRFNANPPQYPTTTNSFTNLGYFANYDASSAILTSISVRTGDVIGILGSRGVNAVNSYAQNPFTSEINGAAVTLQRLGFQGSLVDGSASDVFTEAGGSYSRINFSYSATAAVPEPATWGMMILGFGVVGASMRRRKSNVRTNVSFA